MTVADRIPILPMSGAPPTDPSQTGAAPLTAGAIVVIHNPAAGRGRGRLVEAVMAELARRGGSVRLDRTNGTGDARRLAENAARDGAVTVVVAGGDGTINEVANGLAGAGAALAVVPIGTANVLALELGLPRTPGAIAALALKASQRRIALGELRAGGAARRFLLMAGIGFDARVVANLSVPLKRATGKLAYVWQALVEWARNRPVALRVTAGGAVYECASLVVAKSRSYGGRFTIAPNASLAAESFEVVLFRSGTRLAILRYALALLLGRLDRLRDVTIVTAREIAIEGPLETHVHIDGDLAGRLPARLVIASEQLSLRAPP
jgi:YegS/Rv2252/BmrU family lipid kinase